jgi:chloramphenicol O-acetyltransferase type A
MTMPPPENTTTTRDEKLIFFPKHPLEIELLKMLPELVKRFGGKPLDTTKLPPFQQDGMKYYTDHDTYHGQTDMAMTLKIDITTAEKTYKQHHANEPGATFSLYLMWTLMKAMQEIPGYNFRYINGRWFEFDNLPLFTTARINGEINNLVLTDVVSSSWSTICEKYTTQKQQVGGMKATQSFSYPVFAIATHITSLPLSFTSLHIPVPKKGVEIERPMFVMGQRVSKNDRLYMPFHAKLPHASLHPGLFQALLTGWERIREHVEGTRQLMKANL